MTLTRQASRPAPSRPALTRGGRQARLSLVGAATIAGLAGSAYVGIANPHDPAVPMPVCPFHALTGLDCPGCGGLRMTHDLLHADVAAALTDNALLLLLAPLLLWLLARAALRFVVGRPVSPVGRFEMRGPLGWAVVVAAVVWTVARNLTA